MPLFLRERCVASLTVDFSKVGMVFVHVSLSERGIASMFFSLSTKGITYVSIRPSKGNMVLGVLLVLVTKFK